jgi:hypothetical protein
MKPSRQEEQEDRRYAAISIAIAACVLRPCANHGEVVLSVEDADIRDAFKYGEMMLKSEELQKFFKTRRQLSDSIRAAIVERRSTRCFLCEPNKPH